MAVKIDKYKDSRVLREQAKSYANLNRPIYNNGYTKDYDELYSDLAKSNYKYNADNDGAYRQWADQARALAGLAVASNYNQAQSLTGGYGSTYAATVANQGNERINQSVVNAQPNYMLADESIYQQELSRKQSNIEAAQNAIDMYNNNYNHKVDNYLARKDYLSKKTSNLVQEDYQQWHDDQDYKFSRLDVYQSLAEQKCAKYNKNKNNSGMKAYLNGLVKAGKITQYMADTLYDNYEYEAPKTASGSRSSSRSVSGSGSGSAFSKAKAWASSVSGSGSETADYDGLVNSMDPDVFQHLREVVVTGKNTTNRSGALEYLEEKVNDGTITEEQANAYIQLFLQ